MESEHPGELRLQQLWYFCIVIGKGVQEVSLVRIWAALANVCNPRAACPWTTLCLADVYSAGSTSLMVPKPELLLMSASRSVLLLDCISQIQMETEQSIFTPRSILFPKRRNSAAFLMERRERWWGPCLVQCPALPDLWECHCQNQSSAIFLLHRR